MPNKQFGHLINIAPNLLIMLNTANTGLSSTEVWFNDRNCEPLGIEDSVNLTLIIEQTLKKWDIQQNQNTKNTLKDTAFCHLRENVVINKVKN